MLSLSSHSPPFFLRASLFSHTHSRPKRDAERELARAATLVRKGESARRRAQGEARGHAPRGRTDPPFAHTLHTGTQAPGSRAGRRRVRQLTTTLRVAAGTRCQQEKGDGAQHSICAAVSDEWGPSVSLAGRGGRHRRARRWRPCPSFLQALGRGVCKPHKKNQPSPTHPTFFLCVLLWGRRHQPPPLHHATRCSPL